MPKKKTLERNLAAGATAVLIGLTVGALWLMRDVLVPMAMSALLAFLLAPVATWLERRHFGRIASVILVTGVAFGAIVGLGYVVGKQVYSLASDLPQYKDEIARKAHTLRGTGGGIGETVENLGKAFRRAANEPASAATQSTTNLVDPAIDQAADPQQAVARKQVGSSATTVPSDDPGPLGATPANPLHVVSHDEPATPIGTLYTYLGLILGPLGTAGVVIVFVVFILLEREQLRDRMISLASRGKYTTTTKALDDAAGRISKYMVAQSIVNGTYGMAIAAGLWAIGFFMGGDKGFPSWVLWGALCAVLRFVPYIGPWIAAIFPTALALAVYPGFGVFTAVMTMFIVVELFSNNVVEPWLYGTSTGLSTMAILIAAVFWTWLWGPIGLLLSTPMTVCIVVLGKYVTPLKFFDVLLGDQPALPPSVSFYQRLLAGDTIDAAKIARRAGGVQAKDDKPDMVKQADLVFLPTLRMMRRDRQDEDLAAEDETRISGHLLRIALPPVATDAKPSEFSADAPLVIGVPAHHEADELTLHLLSEALVRQGVRTDVLSTRLLPADVEKIIAEKKPKLVVITIVPPGGRVQARYLSRRIRRGFPDLPILVSYWGKPREFDKLLTQFRNAGASYVLTTMHQTVAQVHAQLDTGKKSLPPPPPRPPVSTPKVIS